jgi:hypothetical protein
MPCRAPTAAASRWKEGPQQHLQCNCRPTRVKSHTLLPSLQACNSPHLKTSKPVLACSANSIRYFLTPRCHRKKAGSCTACCSEMQHSYPRMSVSRLYGWSGRLPGLRDLQIPKILLEFVQQPETALRSTPCFLGCRGTAFGHGVLLGDAAFVSSNEHLQVVRLVWPAAGAERPANSKNHHPQGRWHRLLAKLLTESCAPRSTRPPY